MFKLKLASPLLLVLLAAASSLVSAAAAETHIKPLNVTVDVSFPDSMSELGSAGVKVVNGIPTKIMVGIRNLEKDSVGVKLVGGSLWSLMSNSGGADEAVIVKNLTSLKVGGSLESQQKIEVLYQFTTDMNAQDLLLNLAVVMTTPEGELVTVTAYNETVSIVEQDTSIFDPQVLFLYLILAAGFMASAQFVYNTWLASVIPKQSKQKRTPAAAAAAAANSSTATVGATNTGTTTGSATATGGTYDESWIPEHHIKKQVTGVRDRSGTPTGVRRK